MFQLIAFMLLALALGFKHSYDPDHLIAVSNILHKVKSVKSGMKVGLSWAIGHMITATAITIILYLFKETILDEVLPHLEKLVGIILIILGISSFRDFFTFHSHGHAHDEIVHSHSHFHKKHKENHFHKHMFGIGIIHGLASNGELLVLFAASLAVTSLGVLLLVLGIFSIGVVLGMILFTFIFSYPLLKLHSGLIYKAVKFIAGTTGIVYGTLMTFSLL